MSEYGAVKTEIESLDDLCDALNVIGVQYERHEVATNLYGYKGDRRRDVANVIVRRKNISSASNDLGWVVRPDGTIEAIVSAYDRTQSRCMEIRSQVADACAVYKSVRTLQGMDETSGVYLSEIVVRNGRIEAEVAGYVAA